MTTDGDYQLAAMEYLVAKLPWEDACLSAGFQRVVSIDTVRMKEAFAHVRRRHPNLPVAPERETAPDSDVTRLNDMLVEGTDNWGDLAPLARRVLAKIATGVIKGPAGQVASLKEIIARAEGKIGQDADDPEHLIRVVVLPTLATDDGPTVDIRDLEEDD